MADEPERAVEPGADHAPERGASAATIAQSEQRSGEGSQSTEEASGAEGSSGPRPRRRSRGGRGRGRGGGGQRPAGTTEDGGEPLGDDSAGSTAPVTDPSAKELQAPVAVAPDSPDADGQGAGAPRPPRRRRSRSRSGTGRAAAGSDDASVSADGEDGAEAVRAQYDDAQPDSTASGVPAAGGGPAHAPDAADGSAGAKPPARRRRRRGGRGRSRSTSAGAAPAAEGDSPSAVASEDSESSGTDVVEAAAELTGTSGADRPEGPSTRTRSRRRGGRGRGGRSATGTSGTDRSEKADATADGSASPEAAAGEGATVGDGVDPAPAGTSSRQRTRRKATTGRVRSGGQGRAPTTSRAEPVSGRQDGAAVEAAPQSTRGRRARIPGRRRREPLPQARRGQDKLMLITEHGERDQIAVIEDRVLVEHYITRVGSHSMVGNIYLGRVQNVLPGMEAAFIDIGRGRNAVLYAGEVSHSEDIEGKSPRIEQVLKPAQAVMVQVTKDPIGGKGPRLTQEVSIPGRFLVLVPNSKVFGISRRLPDDERRRLRAIIKKVYGDEHGVIVRTAAEGASAEDLEADLARLNVEWEHIAKRAKKARAPSLLYEEPELTLRVVRDLFNSEEFREIVTDSPRVHERISAYLQDIAPDLVERVRLHDGRLPIFEEFHVVEQIHKALERKIWLASGGYIIIERTEAMTVIDVNTGKHVGKTNLEETVVRTNLEAAQEIARQLRLRDIGGIIIIDFIDMLLQQNREKIRSTVSEELARDKTRSQVFDISPLGILEVTRKRVSAGLLESFSETCPTCQGRGILLTHEIG